MPLLSHRYGLNPQILQTTYDHLFSRNIMLWEQSDQDDEEEEENEKEAKGEDYAI